MIKNLVHRIIFGKQVWKKEMIFNGKLNIKHGAEILQINDKRRNNNER